MRIGASLNGVEQKLLNAANEAAASINALRLATGAKVNAPSDDPSAFVQISGLNLASSR
jgi:flagellin-like hook-associated protein FlgL